MIAEIKGGIVKFNRFLWNLIGKCVVKAKEIPFINSISGKTLTTMYLLRSSKGAPLKFYLLRYVLN